MGYGALVARAPWFKALQLLKDVGLRCDLAVLGAAVRACHWALRWLAAAGLLAQMPQMGLEKDPVAYCSAVAASSGRLRVASEPMSRRGVAVARRLGRPGHLPGAFGPQRGAQRLRCPATWPSTFGP